MRVYDFSNYKEYVDYRIVNMPQKGHGQYRKMAAHLNVSSVQISHVFRGNRDLTDEQALEVAGFFNLNSDEIEYFLTLVHKERSGTVRLKNHYQQKLKKMKDEALATKNRVEKDLELSGAAQAIYYSNWYYGAIRLCFMIPSLNTIPKVAEYLGLPLELVEETVQFLTHVNLVKKIKTDQYVATHQRLYLDKTSPLVSRHHSNWRLKAIENFVGSKDDSEMFYTSPVVVSKDVAREIRSKFVDIIEDIMRRTQAPPDEALHCLNIDWFRVKR